MEVVILGAGLFVFLAHIFELVFERTRIPDILLLMVLGVLCSSVLDWIQPEDLGGVGDFLALVTLLVLLFESGLNLRLKSLLLAAGRAVPFALVSMIMAIGCLTYVIWFFLELEPWTALLGGFILGGTSAAVVIPMLKALKVSESTVTILTLESTLTDVFCIIGTVGIATALAQGGEGVDANLLLKKAGFQLGMAVVVGLFAGFIWSAMLGMIGRFKDTLFTTLAAAMVVYGASEQFGVSGAIATLCFGITMGNMPQGLRFRVVREGSDKPVKVSLRDITGVEKRVYSETVFLLKACFFFYLGMTVEPVNFLSVHGLAALILALTPFFPRLPVTWLFLSGKKTSRKEALLATCLVPRGLAAAVLAQLPKTLGIPGGEVLASVVTMMVFLSIVLVSVSVFLVEKGALDLFGAAAFRRFPLQVAAPAGEAPAEE